MPTFRWSTPAQFRARVREEFAAARGVRACRLAKHIQELALTDAQLRALFGVTAAQLPALKTKLANLANKYDDVAAQVGQ